VTGMATAVSDSCELGDLGGSLLRRFCDGRFCLYRRDGDHRGSMLARLAQMGLVAETRAGEELTFNVSMFNFAQRASKIDELCNVLLASLLLFKCRSAHIRRNLRGPS
jgi:hypothetical protein